MLRIVNIDQDRYVSELLEAVSALAERESGVPSDKSLMAVEGEKGSIVAEILVSMSAAAAWDAVKFVARRTRGRGGGATTAVIEVDGERQSVAAALEDD